MYETKERHFFSLRLSFHLYTFKKHSISVSVQNCDAREFVKRFFKALTKFPFKKKYTGRRVHPENGDPIQILIKMGVVNQICGMQ